MCALLSGTAARASTIVLAIAAQPRAAAAQRADVEASASINIGYSQETQTTFVPDPNGQPQDNPSSTTQRMFTEIRPGIAVQTGSPRLTWRAGYIFAGTLSVIGDSLASASNQLAGSVTAEATPF